MATSRKLLILDLNGTLLVRGSHAKRKAPNQSSISLGNPSVQNSRLRAVHGRPYLPSFREYLFHTETKKWLDTMVWSSAQPHSVADMVQHCFAETKEGLLAIWARDTLGLSPQAYNQKTQTTKDLIKPWAAFPIHSAKTTLLLDDSILKAQLQPWNHLCISEYVSEMREKDLQILRRSSANTAHPQTPKRTGIISEETHTSTIITGTLGLSNNGTSPRPGLLEGTTIHRHDETLLAVIGILDVLKDESNVGKWIRSGGLFSKASSPSEHIIGDPVEDTTTKTMWFEHINLMEVWASRGRNVLNELRIDITAGIKE
ncbi:hypothetical protein BDZ94DRAFT_1176734 [Collybia nuda]|uniref:Mitochondrial import inner membrane translocase subunit TIM50 n=1 Tax=Collybia nuda TaxID=64659 RepID=A0A9P6CC90_9AGAR|nr:hypothetical protein BDZ94DRAFT_1176734 [Collybia nuda]